MSFMNAILNELLDGDNNVSVTENGAIGYRTTGKSLLDINFAVASLRSASEQDIIRRFTNAFMEDSILAVKWLFFARDVRGGLGERRLFREAFKVIEDNMPEKVPALIHLIPEYGRFDDMWPLLDTRFRQEVVSYVSMMLSSDMTNCTLGKPISLLAKWLPSANASSAQTIHYAKLLREGLCMSEKNYRQMLSRLRRYLDVVEVKMSDKRWGDINYETVPSRANVIYNSAFLRNDEERRREFLSKLEKGEAKINSSVLYPHDIVHMYCSASGWGYSLKSYDPAIEAMWKGLPDMVKDCGNTIVVADGSGSMNVSVGSSGVRAIEVANALAIYFAEHSSGEFRDKYITFSEHPQLVDFSRAKSLRDKLTVAFHHCEVANTNVEAVFELILNTALNNKMKQEDIPANILIISDMEFDGCAVMNGPSGYYGRRMADANLFKQIDRKYRQHGYKLPRLVFWNVNSRTGTIPVRENDMGVALVSGFSVNICKMVMSGQTDPFLCLLETLNVERYQPIEDIMRG